MIIRKTYYILLVLYVMVITSLFTIKSKVNTLNMQLKDISKQISAEEQNIALLKVELAYLSAPEQLKEFAEKNSKLSRVAFSKIISDPVVAGAITRFAKNASDEQIAIRRLRASVNNSGSKWRYKRIMNNSYLKQASY